MKAVEVSDKDLTDFALIKLPPITILFAAVLVSTIFSLIKLMETTKIWLMNTIMNMTLIMSLDGFQDSH